MNNVFAYTRVSTPRQGEKGVSLNEQKDAILRYAQRAGLKIVQWFEERETAAKRGRPIFGQVLKLLRDGKTRGLVIHKVDRGARNLKDWADLGDLLDQGVEVYFANEDLDLHSRGGRLSADIQAVVASDYIRNLREETKKGFYGRLKQGLYPRPAPIGYEDVGEGQAKVPDHIQAPLVAKAFELYATGRYSLPVLVDDMFRLGLRTKRGGKVVKNSLNNLLHNPFYMGIINVKRTGGLFTGIHQPIISKSLFDHVQLIFKGKVFRHSQRYEFLFRRLLRCATCNRSLIGETQKGHVYYRCHHRSGPPTCIREDAVEVSVLQILDRLKIAEDARAVLAAEIEKLGQNRIKEKEAEQTSLKLRMGQLQDRLDRLTDAYVDRLIEKDLFERRHRALLLEQKEIQERTEQLRSENSELQQQLTEIVELAQSAYLTYQFGSPDERRDVLSTVMSNRTVDGKQLTFTLDFPFEHIAKRLEMSCGGPPQVRHRIFADMVRGLLKWLQGNPARFESIHPCDSALEGID